jgi:hypothetical protein
MTVPAPDIPIESLRLTFEAVSEVALPAFAGSTWRGAFGHALRDLRCVKACPSPSQCPLPAPCAYRYLFETPRPAGAAKMRLYDRVPHPFVIDAEGSEGRHSPGSRLSIAVTLIGHAMARRSDVIDAMTRAGARGIGRGRGSVQLVGAENAETPGAQDWFQPEPRGADRSSAKSTIAPPPPAVRVRLLTPLRLKENDHNVTPQAFRPHHLLRSLLRRISLLSYFHTDTPLETDFAGLVRHAHRLHGHDVRLSWLDWQRYSSRQKTALSMGGLVGTFVLDMREAEAWWPYLAAGQWLHAGKGTSMGLGKYRLEAPASLPSRDGGPQAG